MVEWRQWPAWDRVRGGRPRKANGANGGNFRALMELQLDRVQDPVLLRLPSWTLSLLMPTSQASFEN